MAGIRERSAAPTRQRAPTSEPGKGRGVPSLRRRGNLLLLSLAMLPVLALAGVLVAMHARELAQRDDLEQQARAAALADRLDQSFTELERAAALMSGLAEPRSSRALQALAESHPGIRRLTVASPGGTVLAVVEGGQPRSARQSPQPELVGLQRLRASGQPQAYMRPSWTSASSAPVDERNWVPALAVALAGPDDEMTGSLEIALDPGWLTGQLRLPSGAAPVLVVDPDGRVALASQTLALVPGDDQAAVALLAAAAQAVPGEAFAGLGSDGRPWRAAVRSTRHDWRVLALRSDAGIEPPPATLVALGAVGLLALLFALVAMVRTRARLWQPIADLGEAIRDSGPRGDIDATLRSGLGRELMPVADGFDAALARVRSAVADNARVLASQKEAQQRLDSALQQREYEVERRTAALRQAVEAFKVQNLVDTLTGLANYRAYRERLEDLWSISRGESVRIAVVAMDIDWFRAYNDQYGHPIGDDCLRQVASLVRSVLGGSARLLARTGGEELSALFLGELDSEILRRLGVLADRLDEAAIVHEGSPLGRVTLSIGLASAVATAGAGPDRLVELADRALYEAKRSGRNRIISRIDAED